MTAHREYLEGKLREMILTRKHGGLLRRSEYLEIPRKRRLLQPVSMTNLVIPVDVLIMVVRVEAS
jgi:hypothetical protein